MDKNTKKPDDSKPADVHVRVPGHVYEPLKAIADATQSSVPELLRRGGKLFIMCLDTEKMGPGAGLYLHKPGHPPVQILLLDKLLMEGGVLDSPT